MGNMFELVETAAPNAVIKVIGVGGGGGNAVNHMLGANIEGVEFICANTDAQAIKACPAKTVLQLGGHVTKGLGAGANPEVGRQAALEDRERIVATLQGADMVFITAGMGGGTGTGAAPVVAQLAKEMGILTVAVVTKPFPFEGRRRMQVALKGIEELSHHVDSLITIPNEKLLTVLGREVNFLNAFRAANDVLLGAVQGIADLITRPGLINVDFADVRTVMSEMGMAMMGSGTGRGDDRALAAAEAAVSNPLLDDINLAGACGILVNITAGANFTMREFEEIGRTVEEFASEDATVVIGTVLDAEMQDDVRVTVVATGLNRQPVQARGPVTGSGREAAREPVREVERAPVRMVRTGTGGPAEFGVGRTTGTTGLGVGAGGGGIGRAGTAAAVPEPSPAAPPVDDYLDIPAFLRRQAD
jgi:cell division protein FtsZ